MSLRSGLFALIAGCVLGWLGRYRLIEPEHVHAFCGTMEQAFTCQARSTLIALTFPGIWGYAALGAAAAAWVSFGRGARLFSVVALVAGGMGLFLFDTAWAASGVIAALLRLPGASLAADEAREFRA